MPTSVSCHFTSPLLRLRFRRNSSALHLSRFAEWSIQDRRLLSLSSASLAVVVPSAPPIFPASLFLQAEEPATFLQLIFSPVEVRRRERSDLAAALASPDESVFYFLKCHQRSLRLLDQAFLIF